jgi:hypothetical protein
MGAVQRELAGHQQGAILHHIARLHNLPRLDILQLLPDPVNTYFYLFSEEPGMF